MVLPTTSKLLQFATNAADAGDKLAGSLSLSMPIALGLAKSIVDTRFLTNAKELLELGATSLCLSLLMGVSYGVAHFIGDISNDMTARELADKAAKKQHRAAKRDKENWKPLVL